MALSGLMSRSSARSARFASSLVRASPPLRPATVVAAMMPRRSLSSLTSEDVERLGAKGLNDPKLKELFEGMCVPGETSIPTDALAKRLAGSDGSSFYTNAGALVELLMTWTAKKMDTNSDGVVSFDEFKSAVRQTEADLLETSFFSTKALEMLGIDSFDDQGARDDADAGIHSINMLKLEFVPAAGNKLVLKLSPPPPLADKQASLADNTTVIESGGNAVGIPSEPVSLKHGIDTGTASTGTGTEGEPGPLKDGIDATGAIKIDPALKPVTKVVTALKPAAAGGAPGDADWNVSTKELPEEEPAPAGIDEWKTPSPLRKIERKGESNLVDGIADWTTPSNPRRNNGRNKGEVKSKKVSNKYDLLDDVETNVAAEIDEVDEKKGREKGAKSGKESSGATVTTEGSVSDSGSWPMFCWPNMLCTVFVCLIAAIASGGAFAHSSQGSGSQPVFAVHDLRRVHVTSLDGRAVLDDASDIAAAGRVRCVAFIISGGVLSRRSFAFAVRSLSPVQPARVFTDIESARLWVNDCVSQSDGQVAPPVRQSSPAG
ncbi:hypothetical protein EMIHUDRAFT_98874 [Emiliania huxleyi CCMP1516]|uniref:EF-hand domain-containing protein n=2 Tax=Emiliania huxleyi TaxID=2903 RepID=A0A0D3KBP3_EMIH1|nr:hypothetical protein EMIHUDRAFT_98874 [Emiliania huxleyi CCMP1516]EOD33178.1 hypothetical protein EMIHUDRAFT_98874 [Emiliania huxleyi CCMP1516]|eukprot:XP_005785607.1 hypothetical protein EMIHUDRAFT_98874 [Emiliania huxleyi CCMP1516]